MLSRQISIPFIPSVNPIHYQYNQYSHHSESKNRITQAAAAIVAHFAYSLMCTENITILRNGYYFVYK